MVEIKLDAAGDFNSLAVDDNQKALDALELTKGIGTPRITSISGGRSSAYMAVHYPADYLIFAVVLTDDPACRITDKGLLTDITKKCPNFEGSRELDQTLKNVLKLEQFLGQEIHWVWGITYDSLIRERKMLPNQAMRFCTQELKVLPIFEYIYSYVLQGEYSSSLERFIPDPVEMQIGYRFDEPLRVYKMLGATRDSKGGWDWSKLGSCEKFRTTLRCDVAGQFTRKHRWIENYEWRFRQAPMFSDFVTKNQVNLYWENRGWEFPEVSNCDFCFFHTAAELRKQKEMYPSRAEWPLRMEKEIGARFNKRASVADIFAGKSTPIIQEGCSACTD
jgi:hypothetical protein